MEEKNTIQFIICPVCQGIGKQQKQLICSNCSGLGLGSFFQGRFLYCELKLNRAVIKFKKIINLLINFTAYLIGIVGLIALGVWMWQVSASMQVIYNFQRFFFWQANHWLLLIFWISVLADMFIVYRISEQEVAKNKIKKFKLIKNQQLPNNWDELKKYKYNINVIKGMSEEVIDIITGSGQQTTNNRQQIIDNMKKTVNSRQQTINSRQLFFSLLKNQEIVSLFFRLNVDVKKIQEKIQKTQQNKASEILNRDFNNLKEILIESYINAYQVEHRQVQVLDLILPCINKDKNLEEILYEFNVDQNKIQNVLEWFKINEKLIKNYKIYKKTAKFKPGKNMDRAYTAVATPVLDHFSYDLTNAAKWGKLELCISREKEIGKIFEIFESGKTGVLLTGSVGVGKNTVVHGIAQLMVLEEVPKFLKDKRLLELDVARLVSGTSPSQAEERMLVIVNEIARAGNIILFIDNIENLAGISAGDEESLELSEVLSNALERKYLYCLAAATNINYTKYIENNALNNIMTRLEIQEPVGNQAIRIIESKIGMFEEKYKVYFSYNAIEQAVKLCSRFIHDKYLPAKAIEVLESTAVRIAKRDSSDQIRSVCSENDIMQSIHDITNIPLGSISSGESEKLLNLEKYIHERMIDQEEAVTMVADSLRRSRAELREGKRPIANFLFLGPTGVGKTELAKIVSEVYFGNENYMIRLDMSEYQHPDSIKKMIGDSQETLGYLTEAVRKQPFSLILLDEFEKAYPDIFNLFLQVMDDGRLTDGQGRTVDFTNSIIIATSNAGALYIQETLLNQVEIDMKNLKQILINEHLNKVIRPELINRFDGIVLFKPLSKDNVIAITNLMLKKIEKMLKLQGIRMRVEEQGACKLADQGYDPKFGARPLRRLLQDKVENQIAVKILSNELVRRDTVVINKNGDVEVEKGRML